MAGLLDSNGARVIGDLRPKRPSSSELIANEGFLPVAALRRTRVKRGLLGSIAFDSEGDITRAPVTVFRVLRGGGSELVSSTGRADRAHHQRSIRAPPLRTVLRWL